MESYYGSRQEATDGRAGLRMNIYGAEPGTKSEASLRILGSWSATPEANASRGDQAAG
jgi:hypothetical protein